MELPARPIVSLGLAALVAITTVGASGYSIEAENYKRLQGMPRERRADLAENLGRFDRLDPKDQAAVRELDTALERKDPIDQARYRSILRRYHLWVSGLADSQKRDLEMANSPEERFNLARKFRLADRDATRIDGPRVSGIRTGDFGLDGPADTAFLLKIWDKLSPADQAQISKRTGREFRNQIRNHAGVAKVRRDWRLIEDESPFILRLESDPDFKAFSPLARRLNNPTPKKPEVAARKVEELDKAARRAEHPIAEFLYFEDNPVRPVASKNLEAFAAVCPSWLLGMLDPLPPEDSRNYLSIVYRQIYPHPAEITNQAKVKPSTGPDTKKASGPAPPP